MASIREAAQNVLEEARDGIAWIAVWREGRSWNSETFWPTDFDEMTNRFTFYDEDRIRLEAIVEADELAAFVNGYYCNLGGVDDMTRDSLADALRWQYEGGHARLSDDLRNAREEASA